MTEEPEQVLPQDHIATGLRGEEQRAELAVESHHEQGDGDDRERRGGGTR